jgi:hypothetical protein
MFEETGSRGLEGLVGSPELGEGKNAFTAELLDDCA